MSWINESNRLQHFCVGGLLSFIVAGIVSIFAGFLIGVIASFVFISLFAIAGELVDKKRGLVFDLLDIVATMLGYVVAVGLFALDYGFCTSGNKSIFDCILINVVSGALVYVVSGHLYTNLAGIDYAWIVTAYKTIFGKIER